MCGNMVMPSLIDPCVCSGVLGCPRSCLHAILSLLQRGSERRSGPEITQQAPHLAELCYQVHTPSVSVLLSVCLCCPVSPALLHPSFHSSFSTGSPRVSRAIVGFPELLIFTSKALREIVSDVMDIVSDMME